MTFKQGTDSNFSTFKKGQTVTDANKKVISPLVLIYNTLNE